MFIYALLILVVWGGAIATDYNCEEGFGGGVKCRNLSEVGFFEFPQSEADIDRMCPRALRFLECLKEFEDECGAERIALHNYSRRKVEALIDLINDICQKDSQLHINLVANLDCMKNQAANHLNNCVNVIREKLENLRTYIRETEREQDMASDMWLDYQCLYQALEIACYVSSVSENCGKEAEDATMEILMRAEYLDDACPQTSRESAIEVMKMLELELEEETDVKNIISTH